MPSTPETFLYVFECNKDTEDECVNARMFGSSEKWVLGTKTGDKCVLYNYESRMFVGLFVVIHSGYRLEPKRWSGRFSYQAKVGLLRCSYKDRHEFEIRGRIPNILKSSIAETIIRVYENDDPIDVDCHIGKLKRLQKKIVLKCGKCGILLKTTIALEDFVDEYKGFCPQCSHLISCDEIFDSDNQSRFNCDNKIQTEIVEIEPFSIKKLFNRVFGRKT